MKSNGVVDSVPAERWERAQKWEQAHWQNAQRVRSKFFKNHGWRLLALAGLVPKYRGDDCNLWWKSRFDDYKFLPARIPNALEAGCGPYTNMRVIEPNHQIDHLVLSDPLIRTYAKFQLNYVADKYANVACILDDHPLEELPFASDYFDLTVMVNVLDHVRDANACLQNLIRVTRPGGIMIVGQELTNEEDLKAIEQSEGRIGHPITVDKAWFDGHLQGRFSPIIDKVLSREEGRGPLHHYGTLLFAGKKL